MAAFTAVGEDHAEELRRLAAGGADLKLMYNGETTLAHPAAVHSRDPEIFRILEEHNLPLWSKDDMNATPMDLALENDNTAAFDLFLAEKGGLSELSQEGLDEYLESAIQLGAPGIVAELLGSGADIRNLRKKGTPALNSIPSYIIRDFAYLSEAESTIILRKLVKLLMEAGADPDWTDDYGWSGYEIHEDNPAVLEAMKEMDNCDGM